MTYSRERNRFIVRAFCRDCLIVYFIMLRLCQCDNMDDIIDRFTRLLLSAEEVKLAFYCLIDNSASHQS